MFKFALINNDNTLQIIFKPKPSRSSGQDSISINTLKIIINKISLCITRIINQCLLSGIFPNKLKMVIVVPIFKKTSYLELPSNINFPNISELTHYCRRSNMDLYQIDLPNLLH